MAQKKKNSKRSVSKPRPARSGQARSSTGAKTSRRGAAGTASRQTKAAAKIDDPIVARIQRVIDVMVAAGAVEVELEEAGAKLRVRLKGDLPVPMMSYPAPQSGPAFVAAPTGAGGSAGDVRPATPVVDDPRRQVFKSPMVGTFYRAAAPDADLFVEVGDRVDAESTICILEAMKVMNEIKAEMSGEVVEILAQNGEPVEFGQPLFVIRVD